MNEVDQITAQGLLSRLRSESAPVLVDTRSTADFNEWHIDGAINYRFTPDDGFDPDDFQEQTGIGPSQPIITICGKGVASKALAEDLTSIGYESVKTVQDGMRGWSRVYEVAALPTRDPEIDIMQVFRPAKGCLGYMVGWGPAAEAAVIDPTQHIDQFLDLTTDTAHEITHVIDTHIHADHISGGRALADKVDATYYLSNRAGDRSVAFDYEPLGRNEVVSVGPLELKAIATPGHTSEMMSILVNDDAVFTGDTLFVDSVGRTELQFEDGEVTNAAHQMYESLHGSLLSLPDAITVLPGHSSTSWQSGDDGVFTSIGDVRTNLDLLQLDEERFVANFTDALPDKPPNYETIIEINTGNKELPSPEEAEELELGPNRCAISDS